MEARQGKAGRRSTTPEAAATYEHRFPEPATFARNMAHVAAKCQELLAGFLRRAAERAERGERAILDPLNIGGAFAEYLTHLVVHPRKLAQAQLRLFQNYVDLWQTTVRRILGEQVPPLIRPEPGDRRFRYHEWDENEIFDFIKQSYLLTARWLQDTIAEAEHLDPKTRRKVAFYTKQFADALAPSNFLLTNPEVLRTTLAENGENLVRGLNNLLNDLERGDGHLFIKQSDMQAFEVGRNIAVTKGKVIYENELMQLIQYAPLTDEVYRRPLLIIPPWINKYYILDLNEEKSFVKWAVEQGYTTFIVSWVNPGPELANKTFEDYMRAGLFAALDAVEKQTGEREANVLGYCIGGTLLAVALAYMAKTRDQRISSATYLAAQIDFSEPGDLELFVDDAQLDALKQQMDAAGGVLPSHAMYTTFNMLRANDLIWNYVVNNYLLGRDPFPFDLLYWNSDQTRMPCAMHLYYLREFYQKNRFARGELEIGGEKLSPSDVKVPTYMQSSKEDHIAPYRSVFKGAKLLGGPVRFIVAGSGHIAGVINPPQLKKYQYWVNDKPCRTIEEWWAGAEEHPGSWWVDWEAWLRERSGKKVPARDPAKGPLKPIEDAPGRYVRSS